MVHVNLKSCPNPRRASAEKTGCFVYVLVITDHSLANGSDLSKGVNLKGIHVA